MYQDMMWASGSNDWYPNGGRTFFLVRTLCRDSMSTSISIYSDGIWERSLAVWGTGIWYYNVVFKFSLYTIQKYRYSMHSAASIDILYHIICVVICAWVTRGFSFSPWVKFYQSSCDDLIEFFFIGKKKLTPNHNKQDTINKTKRPEVFNYFADREKKQTCILDNLFLADLDFVRSSRVFTVEISWFYRGSHWFYYN